MSVRVEITSPCTGICRLDGAQHQCLGCGRTLDEIASWCGANDDTRREIVRAAAARRAQSDARPAP